MTTTTKLTVDEFLRRADTRPASEYACGEVHRKPMPDNPHAALQAYFIVLLFPFLVRTGLGRVRPEWRCVFGPPGDVRVYVPDVVYSSFGRLPRGDTRLTENLPTAPDLAIEVLSRRQKRRPLEDKLRFYLANGVLLVWVVDPRQETIRVLAPHQPERLLRRGDTLDGGEVLPGFTASVDEIMAQLVE